MTLCSYCGEREVGEIVQMKDGKFGKILAGPFFYASNATKYISGNRKAVLVMDRDDQGDPVYYVAESE